jgi:hypothetical protein
VSLNAKTIFIDLGFISTKVFHMQNTFKISKSFKLFLVFLTSIFLTSTLFPFGSAYSKEKEFKDNSKITLWSRKKGPHHDTPNPPRINEKIIKLSDLSPSRKKMFDAQYARTETYIGLPLSKIIKNYKKQHHDDSIVLHFANQMAILLDLEDEALGELAPFIAMQKCTSPNTCDKDFPSISKDDVDSPYQDPRPIVFNGGKLSVLSLSHPDLINPKNPVFSPWKYVDTLVGIEFVNKKAYKKQFFFGEEEGERVFWHRCQYCHGVRLIGARMGWDFVNPLPIFEKRRPEILLNHVKYPKTRAKQMGLMMPPQPDIQLPEAETLWRWLKMAAQKPSPEYLP